MENPSYVSYVLYGSDDCPEYVMCKALLHHCGLPYRTSNQACDEWPEELAIYGITSDGIQELIGGYTALIALLPEGLV